MLDGPESLALGEFHVLGSDVVLEVDKGDARPRADAPQGRQAEALAFDERSRRRFDPEAAGGRGRRSGLRAARQAIAKREPPGGAPHH